MLEQITNHLRGYLKIEITGYSPERFLNLCKNKEILIWGLEAKANAYEMYITIDGFKKLKPLLKKTKTKIQILEKYGVPFFAHKYRKRKIFGLGLFLSMCLIYGLSLFIWKIEIEGNLTITDEVMIEFLKEEKVYHGMRRSMVKCEEIGTQIRKQFDDIIWVSVSLDGTNLIVQVKENTDTFQVSQTEEAASDIVSVAEGVITEIVTRSGVPLVKVGDTVKQGDVLVTGKIGVMNDAGEIVREEYKSADADIWAEVLISYDDFCEAKHEVKQYNQKRHKQIYWNVFGYQAAFGIKKNESKNYEISASHNQVKLNENFELPIYFGETIGKGYELEEADYTKEEQKQVLTEAMSLYCKKLEEKDCIILENQVQMREEAGGMRAKGYLKVKQPIGTARKTIDFLYETVIE